LPAIRVLVETPSGTIELLGELRDQVLKSLADLVASAAAANGDGAAKKRGRPPGSAKSNNVSEPEENGLGREMPSEGIAG
jgi:hypothetical protein